ncbi:MAG: hypothetical protein WC385_00275 [Candidatus Paceibacterota bacterium]|jgi:hypothetical protein
MADKEMIDKFLNDLTAVLRSWEGDPDSSVSFSCDNGPSLRQASDSIGIFTPGQKVYCLWQTLELNSQKVPMFVLGFFPFDLKGSELGKYLIVVEIAPEGEGLQLNEGSVSLKKGERFLGVGSFHSRFWRFIRLG